MIEMEKSMDFTFESNLPGNFDQTIAAERSIHARNA